MECKIVSVRGTWRDVADCARVTVNMEPGTGEPPGWWRRDMLLAEHSPIREITFTAEWTDMPYWVAMHLVRHHEGCQPYVMSQRDDRQKHTTEQPRGKKPQDAPVKLRMTLNQQAIINISRKRLCGQAAAETRKAWKMFLYELLYAGYEELYSVCVPECVYRGFCPELKSCGWCDTEEYRAALENYRGLCE